MKTASRAEDALSILNEDPPDLIVLDLNMPVIDGRAFYQLARSTGYEGPVIICSAFGAPEAQRELGADAALSKPFRPEDLVGLIRSLIPAG